MTHPTLTLEVYGNKTDPNWMTLSVRVEKEDYSKTVQRTFCQSKFKASPELIPQFFRELADEIDQIV